METNSAAPALRAMARARRAARRCRRSASSAHPVFAGLLDAFVQALVKFEDDSFLLVRRSAALVPCRLPPWPGSRTTTSGALVALFFFREGRRRRIRAGRSAIVESGPAQKISRSVAAIEHQAGRRTVRGVDDEGFSIRTGLARSKTIREPPCITRPKRKALIRPRPLSPVFGGSRNTTCGMSRTTPIGIGKSEGAQVDLAAQIHDETHLRFVAAEPGVGRNRKRIDGETAAQPAGPREPRSEEDTENAAAQPPAKAIGSPRPSCPLTPLGRRG